MIASHSTTGHAAADARQQVERMRAAVQKAVRTGREFQRGKVDADTMAHTMTSAVKTFVQEEAATGSDGQPRSDEARELAQVLVELNTCGSGYLAGRCDAA